LDLAASETHEYRQNKAEHADRLGYPLTFGKETVNIDEAIEKLEQEVKNSSARCVLPSDGGCVGESSLFGTRDAFIRLAIALLETVRDRDNGIGERDSDTGAFWDDRIKDCLLQLPNQDASIVGSYLFRTHREMMEALAKFTEWDGSTIHSIQNDPDFKVESDPEA
jgi:hypothetical protein